ncbi:2-oxoglutarate dehydrogenase E1 component domain protein, partial [Chlamydia psittaci C1/97]
KISQVTFLVWLTVGG